MSRKWERMVAKNRKMSNKQRIKQGRESIADSGRERMVPLRGRNWFLPLVLLAIAIFYAVTLGGIYQMDASFWITFGGYVLLAALIFLVRRPVLRVGKTHLSSRRFAGDKTVAADNIDEITLSPGAVVIQLKHKKTRWMFTRLIHRFPMAQAHSHLKEFAKHNGVRLVDESGA